MRGPAGLGAGAFMWFETKEKLVEFVKLYPFLGGNRPSQEELNKVESLADEIKNESMEMDVICKQINETLNDPYIDWLGTFEDLLNGRGDFAHQLIEEFREETEGDGFEIQADEVDDFMDFVLMYGI